MPSIRDVAAHAGVSITTVSRVINQDPHNRISPETCALVNEAIRKLHYEPRPVSRKSPHPAAPRFRAGCITNSLVPKFTDHFYMAVVSGFEAEMGRMGGELAFIKTPLEIGRGEQLRACLRDIDYLVTIEYLEDDLLEEIKGLVNNIVGVDAEDWRMDHVGYDRMQTGAAAADYLLAHGHRRIAYIGGEDYAPVPNPLRSPINDGRYVGYCHMLGRYGLIADEALVHNCLWEMSACEGIVRELMALSEPPTAILAASDNLAISAISACGKLGLDVPGDVSIIGINDIDEAQFSNPPLTTIRVPQAEMGEEAARLLLREDYRTLPRKILLPTTLVVRSSTKALHPAVI